MDEAQDLKLAVTEACSMVILRDLARSDVLVQCHLHDDVLAIEVSRSLRYGVPEAPDGLPLLELAQAGRDEPHLGYQLIDALMDDVTVAHDRHTGRYVVRMQRILAGRLAGRVTREG